MSASTIVHTALKIARQALASYDRDPRRARVDLVQLERYLDEKSKEFTPIDPADPTGRNKAHESSSRFRAADAVRHLEEGKRAVAAITRRKSLPPKSR